MNLDFSGCLGREKLLSYNQRNKVTGKITKPGKLSSCDLILFGGQTSGHHD